LAGMFELTTIRRFQPGHQTQQGRLAAAGAAQQNVKSALFQLQIIALQNFPARTVGKTIAMANIAQLRHAAAPFPGAATGNATVPAPLARYRPADRYLR